MLTIAPATALAELVSDRVIYRGLRPQDEALPGLDEVRRELGLAPDRLPRKAEPEYARVVAAMLRRAHELAGGGGRLGPVVLLGDTLHSDVAAYRNLCVELECGGAAFVGGEDSAPARLEVVEGGPCAVLRANRWSLLARFEERAARMGVVIGPGAVLVVDIDKTALGARGRNHRPIDAARREAAARTLAELLGGAVDSDLVRRAYDRFNRPACHPFTGDNQDFVAYLAVLVGAGWGRLSDLEERIAAGSPASPGELLAEVSRRRSELPAPLGEVHREVAAAVAAGDPTPFKLFRRAEFVETVGRMGGDGAGEPEALASDELFLTREVLATGLEWRARGALAFGLSDKPDEASLPTPELAAAGYLPLHRTPARTLGEE